MGRLILIPWHIGNRLDVTLNALLVLRRLRCLLAEDPAGARQELEGLVPDCPGKSFRPIPHDPEPGFLAEVLGILRRQDVGLLSSGGAPCFVDPGGWLVRKLRRQGIPILALAGASSLSTVLSLSGLACREFRDGGGFSFAFFLDRTPGERARFLKVLGRDQEPVVVFLPVRDFAACLEAMRGAVGQRLVSAFFDLTKTPKSKFPFADEVRTMTCRQWLRQSGGIPWGRVSDLSLVVHPEGER